MKYGVKLYHRKRLINEKSDGGNVGTRSDECGLKESDLVGGGITSLLLDPPGLHMALYMVPSNGDDKDGDHTEETMETSCFLGGGLSWLVTMTMMMVVVVLVVGSSSRPSPIIPQIHKTQLPQTKPEFNYTTRYVC